MVKIPDHLKDEIQGVIVHGLKLKYTFKEISELISHEYGLNLSCGGIRYQLPGSKEAGKIRWKEYYQKSGVKEHKKEYMEKYCQRSINTERRRIRNGNITRELISSSFVVTDKGNSVVNLGIKLDDGFRHGTIMTILNVINLKGTPNKYEILDVLKTEGYFNPDSTKKGFQLNSVTKTLKRLEEDEFIEKFNYLPDWLFGQR